MSFFDRARDLFFNKPPEPPAAPQPSAADLLRESAAAQEAAAAQRAAEEERKATRAANDAAREQYRSEVAERRRVIPDTQRLESVLADRVDDGHVRYHNKPANDHKGRVLAESWEDHVAVAPGESAVVAVAVAKERFGPALMTTSHDSAVMRDVLSSGARIEHFVTNEQRVVYMETREAMLRERNLEPALPQKERVRDAEPAIFFSRDTYEQAQEQAQKRESLSATGDRASEPIAVEHPNYNATQHDDGIHYGRDGEPDAIIDTGSTITARAPEDYAAAVAIAKERFGPQVETDSLDPAFLRAAHEGGLELQNLSAEQTAIYERVKADIVREQAERTPEAVRDAQEPSQAQEHHPSDEHGLPATAQTPEVVDFDKALADDAAATPKPDNVVEMKHRVIDVPVQPDPPDHDDPEQGYGYGH